MKKNENGGNRLTWYGPKKRKSINAIVGWGELVKTEKIEGLKAL